MGESVNLQKTGLGWEFETEAALEDFVWANLPRLFNLSSLNRQQEVKGQFCDILGLGENHQLAVLELKNTEDRYIVQQITRYYDALLEEKPFAENVDYNLPIRLIAIAPSFHRDNFIDRKYCHLDIHFLQFVVIADGEKFYLQFRDVESDRVWQIEIPHEERVNNDDIPPVPKKLEKILTQFEPGQQENILKFRHKILTFDKRMAEFSINGNISYGCKKGKNVKLCAELYTNSQGIMIPFLWLPLKGLTSEKIGRARIWTDWNDLAVVEGYVSKGIGPKISLHKKRIARFLEQVKQIDELRILGYFYLYGSMLVPEGEIEYKTNWTDNEWKALCNFNNNLILTRRKVAALQPVTWEDVQSLELFEYLDYYYDAPHLYFPHQSLNELLDLALNKWLLRI